MSIIRNTLAILEQVLLVILEQVLLELTHMELTAICWVRVLQCRAQL